MDLSPWLNDLRRTEITECVKQDKRTSGQYLLGVHKDRIFNEVIGGGQADFDLPWEHLTPDERVLLYAYFNQKGHIEELTQAFSLLFDDSSIENPVVVDLGCGPFTGGLALANVLGRDAPFTYIGVDRSSAMRRLGEKLATAAVRIGGLHERNTRLWVNDLDSVPWASPPGWRPVLVIVSYLLASPTLDASVLVTQVESMLRRLGHGPVTVLYTNSPKSTANRSFPEFRAALEGAGFELIRDETGRIQVDRWSGSRDRELKYALFQRQSKNVLRLGGG